MKKRIIMGLTGLVVMAAAITATLTTVNGTSNDSGLLSQNLEALTNGENAEKHVKLVDQGSRFVYDEHGQYVYKVWCYCYGIGEGTLDCPCY